MNVTRRGFFGGLLAMFGGGTVATQPVDLEYKDAWDKLIQFVEHHKHGGWTDLRTMDMNRYNKMKSGIDPSGVIRFDDGTVSVLPESEIQEIHKEWRREFQECRNHRHLEFQTPGSETKEFGGVPSELSYESIPGFKLVDGHARLQLLADSKALTKNEFREQVGLPRVTAAWGDELVGT